MTGSITALLRRPRGRWVRRASGALSLVLALSLVGIAYSAFTSRGDAAPAADSSANVVKGQQLYDQTCITCHGANLQGVQDRGPSLIGVGEAAAYFQLRTGRMPAAQQGPENDRKRRSLSEAQIAQISAYIQANGGGPTIPEGNLRGGAIGEGGELFRLNCASCHNLAGQGGALSGGKVAPRLKESTDKELYAAMLSGPENMPVFGDNQITPEQKRALINYIQNLKASADPGGNGIGRLGPVPEGAVAWIIGIGLLLFIILWIGAKSGARGPSETEPVSHAGAGTGSDGPDGDAESSHE